jgi:hypothetical protein
MKSSMDAASPSLPRHCMKAVASLLLVGHLQLNLLVMLFAWFTSDATSPVKKGAIRKDLERASRPAAYRLGRTRHQSQVRSCNRVS